MKMYQYHIKISLKFVSRGLINNILAMDLAPTRPQALIWANDG